MRAYNSGNHNPIDILSGFIAKPFGIVHKGRLLLTIACGLLLIVILLLIWHYQTVGCVLARPCDLSDLGASDLIGISLAIVVLGWSVGIGISQNEQASILQGMASAQQRFDSKFLLQLSKLDEYIGRIPSDHEKLEMQIYVSSPAFGILTGPRGLSHFVAIVGRFVEAALARAKDKRDSSLHLYFWNEDEHKRIFSPTAKPHKPIWDSHRTKQRRHIADKIKELSDLFSRVHSSNIKHTSDPRYTFYDGLIRVYQFEVRRDECRFFMLDTGREQRAAMIAMAPIGGERDSDLHSVLLMDNTKGMDKIKEFSEAFMSQALKGEDVRREAEARGADLCKDPGAFFRKYFDYDFHAETLPPIEPAGAGTSHKTR